MPPIAGECGLEKAERLRKASNVLREKARYCRVTNVLKTKPAICARVEETLIQEGELTVDMMSPREPKTKNDDDNPGNPPPDADGRR